MKTENLFGIDPSMTVIKPLLMSPHAPEMQYIVTLTLEEHLQSFKRVGLKIPDCKFIQAIEQGILKKIEHGFRGSSVRVVSKRFDDQCNCIVSTMRKIRLRRPDAVVVSTTPLITHDTDGVCVHLTRLVDNGGNLIGIGSRSGQHSIDRQIDLVQDRIKNRQIIIVEDGAFTGKTLICLLGHLKKRNTHVIAIVLGILFPAAAKNIEEQFKGELIFIDDFPSPLDWMPVHDFLPFLPNSGRVIGTSLGNSLIALNLQNHATLSIPYVMPYGLPNEWGGLAFNTADLQDFSRHCLLASTRIFQEMEHINERIMTIGDVIGTMPATSIPVAIHQEQFDAYDLENRIIDILNNDYERI